MYDNRENLQIKIGKNMRLFFYSVDLTMHQLYFPVSKTVSLFSHVVGSLFLATETNTNIAKVYSGGAAKVNLSCVLQSQNLVFT